MKLLKLDHLSLCQNQKKCNRPRIIINNYGADAVRLFISDSPPEKMFSGQNRYGIILQIHSKIRLHLKIKSKFQKGRKVSRSKIRLLQIKRLPKFQII